MKLAGKSMRNQKLTPILAGRTIKHSRQTGGVLQIEFHDGSILKIKVGAPLKGAITGRRVKAVRQRATEFDLDFTDGTSAAIALAAETSSVMLRDAAGAMEYAD